MPLNEFTPNIGDKIINPQTGEFTEIGRILVRNLSAAVGALAPVDAQYWTSTPAAALTNERNIGALASGYVKITTAAGIATPSTVPSVPLADVTTLSAGIYTPTLFNTTNVSASTAYSAQYIRVGSSVTVSGRVDVDPTAAVATLLGISLPIASALANDNECAGVAASPVAAGESAAIEGDVANGRASLRWVAVDLTNHRFFFTFTYRVQ
jgi:hypothetical protein